ncbi:sigma-54 dependent transcriptional regulator [Ruficoccus sp. ZRK36]|uniref:sigma-54-dependent transcriptional regulator n=1 Tax=Ruficoccus sp. ZRK36 TaxID=2866311 RepID=UPI001C735E27|nr:sigma-54 dependent transcriptional regulator [Ruficoccus sp. ZRK36]QYY37365.1 sigma-54 dependent transcriptional regulator [Ruficoccus sp. ZRK36]
MSKKSPVVLVIDDDTEIRYSLERILSARQYQVVTADSGEEGLKVAKEVNPVVILLDNRMGGMSGIETLQHLRHTSPQAMVILMTAFGTAQTAIEAMKFGAFDYIIKPFDVKKILGLVEKAVSAYEDSHQEKEGVAPVLNSEDYKEGIVGSSEPMQEVLKIIGQVAASDATVMITGESGTGKELVARCIYQHSHRNGKAFIAVNCAAIPENLIESELFGHEKGSFTGATGQRKGKFELCDGGTIFLDEIGDMSPPTQTKILRALQEGEIQRVGGTDTIKVDVRLIAATNKDLEHMVSENTFREDLYYRLNVFRIRLPSLRERLEDIPMLVEYMLQKLVKDRKARVSRVSTDALAILQAHNWPGNVRELENVMFRSAVIAQGDTILRKDLPTEIVSAVGDKVKLAAVPSEDAPAEEIEVREPDQPEAMGAPAAVQEPTTIIADTPPPPSPDEAFDLAFATALERNDTNVLVEVEKEVIRRALSHTGGNQAKAASILGITRATLKKRMDQYDITV